MNEFSHENKKDLDLSQVIAGELKKIPPGTHLTAPDIHKRLTELNYDVSISSIYRVLAKLKVSGGLNVIQSDKLLKYEYKDVDHDHLICLTCGVTVEFSDEFVHGLGKALSKRKNFTFLNSRFDIYGYCQACKNQQVQHLVEDLKVEVVALKKKFSNLLNLFDDCQSNLNQADLKNAIKILELIKNEYNLNQKELVFLIESIDKS